MQNCKCLWRINLHECSSKVLFFQGLSSYCSVSIFYFIFSYIILNFFFLCPLVYVSFCFSYTWVWFLPFYITAFCFFFSRVSETGNIVLTYTGAAFFEEFFKIFPCLVHFCPATCSIRKFVCMLRVRVRACVHVCLGVSFSACLYVDCVCIGLFISASLIQCFYLLSFTLIVFVCVCVVVASKVRPCTVAALPPSLSPTQYIVMDNFMNDCLTAHLVIYRNGWVTWQIWVFPSTII